MFDAFMPRTGSEQVVFYKHKRFTTIVQVGCGIVARACKRNAHAQISMHTVLSGHAHSAYTQGFVTANSKDCRRTTRMHRSI